MRFAIWLTLIAFSFACGDGGGDGDGGGPGGGGPGGGDGDGGGPGLADDFAIPGSEVFAANLSAYGLYQGDPADLVPSAGTYVYELSSQLFTDYASKQRLIQLPEGQSATFDGSGAPDFPDGTVIAKTFFYPDPDAGGRVIETRLLVRNAGEWNVATYVWNDDQSDAVLDLQGTTTPVSWVSGTGEVRTTTYEVPGEVECVTCHQSNNSVVLLGLTLRNMNRPVSRGGEELNQLAYLEAESVLSGLGATQIPTIPNYDDLAIDLESRARAYLDSNCSHCHSPNAWEESATEGLDFRFETPLANTGILGESDDIAEVVADGEMPYLGTTVLHDEGVALILEFLDDL